MTAVDVINAGPARDVYATALEAWDAGFAVIRARDNGTKAPKGDHRRGGKWEHWQTARPDRDTVEAWFRDGYPGIGVICGAVSGNLEMFEFEGKAVAEGMYSRFLEQLEEAGLASLWLEITLGWSEETPSGGLHFYYRVKGETPGTTKLATRPVDDGTGLRKLETLIETKGEGGFSVIAPSHGSVHKAGPYVRSAGGPSTVVTITPEQRARLFEFAGTFHVSPVQSDAVAPVRPVRPKLADDGWISKVEQKLAEVPWGTVLGWYGWTYVHTVQHEDYWRHPDSTNEYSATTNANHTDTLIVFSPTPGLAYYTGIGKAPSHNRLDVIAHYEHNGDRVAAAYAYDPEPRDTYNRERFEAHRERERAEFERDARARTGTGADAPPAAAGDEAEHQGDAEQSDGRSVRAFNRETGEFEEMTLEQFEAERRPFVIVNNRELRDVRDQTLQAVQAHNERRPALFTRGGAAVSVTRDENGRALIVPVTEAAIRNHATDAADFSRKKTSETKPPQYIAVSPPRDVLTSLLALDADRLRFPRLVGVTEVPIIRPDGTIRTAAGYDATTALYYQPDPALRLPAVPEHPTPEQVRDAVATLSDPFIDFPFTDQASQANMLGLIIGAVVRPAIEGNVPLGIISATTPGSGKGLLTDVAGLIALGRKPAYLSMAEDEDEVRKAITSALESGSTLNVFDNLEGSIRSARLASALTAGTWADRVLGKTHTLHLPVRCSWVANGNNVTLRGDLPRRAYWVKLDPRLARPWRRSGFRHPDLPEYVLRHRGDILAAVLTLARAWFAAGRPAPKLQPVGSFENWCRMVGGMLEVAGVEGFLANAEELYESADPELEEWAAFVEQIGRQFDRPFTASELAAVLEAQPITWREVIPSVLAGELNRPTLARAIGERFAEKEGRRWDDLGNRIARKGKNRAKVTLWTVETD